MSIIRRLPRGPSAQIFIANVCTQLFGLLITLISATTLTTTDFGKLTGITIFVAILPLIASLGLPDAMLTASALRNRVRESYASGAALLLGLSIGAGLAMYFVARFLLAASPQECALAAAYVSVTMWSSWLLSLEQRLRNFGAFNRLTVASNGVALLLAAAAIANSGPEASVSYFLTARAAPFGAIVLYRLIYRRHYLMTPDLSTSLALVRSGVRYNISSVLSVGASRVDQVLSTNYLGAQSMSALGLVLPFANATRTVGQALGTVSSVDIIETDSAQERHSLILVAAVRSALASFAVSIALGAVVYLAWRFTETVPSEPFVVVGTYMVAAAITSVTEVLIRLQRVQGRYVPGILARGCSFVVGVAIGLALVPTYGIVGAGVTAAASATVGGLVMMIDLKRPHGTNASEGAIP